MFSGGSEEGAYFGGAHGYGYGSKADGTYGSLNGAEAKDQYGTEGSGAECFSGDTLILMADGSEKPIEDITAGDQVASFSKLGALKNQTVLENMVTGKRRLINIDGVKATPPHPFLCANGKWAFARELEAGMELVKADGSSHVIQAARPDGHATQVYNLEVDGGDCFVAGGFRVHNSTIICAELHRQGWFTDEEWQIERRYSRYENPFRGRGEEWDSVSHTYRLFAKPMIALSRRAPMTFARALAACIRPWITELGFRYADKPKGHILGHLAMAWGTPIVRLLWGIKRQPAQIAKA